MTEKKPINPLIAVIPVDVLKAAEKSIRVSNTIEDIKQSLVPMDQFSVGKRMTKPEVIKFINNLPEPNYFIRWDYKNSQYKMLEIIMPGEKFDV